METKITIRNHFKSILLKKKKDSKKDGLLVLSNFKRLLNNYYIKISSFSFCGYYPINNEINDLPLLEYIISCQGLVALPKIKNGKLEFLVFNKETILIKNKYGIFEPKDGITILPDIILLPLLSFDKKGNRIGYGKGYYDKTIADMIQKKHKPILIGIAYKNQEYKETLPVDLWDIPLDVIITEKDYTLFRNTAMDLLVGSQKC